MKLKIAMTALLLGLGMNAAPAYSSEFTHEDIDIIKSRIKSDYLRKGFKVSEIFLAREAPEKLLGFVKVTVSGIDITLSCTGTLLENDEYIFACKP